MRIPAKTLKGVICKARIVEGWMVRVDHGGPGFPFDDLDWDEKCAI